MRSSAHLLTKFSSLANRITQIPCRRRKVRCELGPVDAPQDPPCARCRREGKSCVFSATLRRRKAGEDEHTSTAVIYDSPPHTPQTTKPTSEAINNPMKPTNIDPSQNLSSNTSDDPRSRIPPFPLYRPVPDPTWEMD